MLTAAAVATVALGGTAASRQEAVPESVAVSLPQMGFEEVDAGGEEREVPITGAELENAKAAALAHLEEGVVTGTEVDDEESYYEVEVRLPNGHLVDVQLDQSLTVVGIEGESGDDG